MKMEVVTSYDENRGHDEIEGMVGKRFKSFNEAIKVLKPGQCITLTVLRGYKQVGVNKNGQGWVQRYAAPEW